MLLIVLTVLSCFCPRSLNAQDDLLVCKPARNLFSAGVVTSGGEDLRLSQGPSGKRGPKGERGYPGIGGPKGAKGSAGNVDYDLLEQKINERPKTFSSCKELKAANGTAANGLYDIYDEMGSAYRTYCDFETGGGGWTLVASVHENFMQGKCTIGDRWSSEQGYNSQHPHGDGNWENMKIFGAAESATSDDYKNPGYFNMDARDVMIWHVPNDTPMRQYKESAFMMYHTSSGFLGDYGGNLQKLFKNYYPLKDRTYTRTTGNGPSPPIIWDRGDNDFVIENTAPNVRPEVIPGYLQFRVINNERGAFAICPGVKIKPAKGNVEHCCIGGTSYHGESVRQCGDFAGKDWNGYGTGVHWSSNLRMTESVVMIFYR